MICPSVCLSDKTKIQQKPASLLPGDVGRVIGYSHVSEIVGVVWYLVGSHSADKKILRAAAHACQAVFSDRSH